MIIHLLPRQHLPVAVEAVLHWVLIVQLEQLNGTPPQRHLLGKILLQQGQHIVRRLLQLIMFLVKLHLVVSLGELL